MNPSKIKNAKSFVQMYINRIPSLESYRDDLLQEALIGVLNAGKSFDPSRGAALSTLEWWHMRKRVSAFIEMRISPTWAYATGPIGDGEEDALDYCADLDAGPEVRVQTKLDSEWFLNTEIPRRCRKRFGDKMTKALAVHVARARLEGDTFAIIAARFGISRQRAEQISSTLGLP